MTNMENIEEKIVKLEREGLKASDIAKILGKNRNFIYYHNTKAINERKKKKDAFIKANQEFEELVKRYLPLSNSMNEVCENLGLKGVKEYYDKIQRVIDKYKLSTDHFGKLKNHFYIAYLKRNLDEKGKFLAMSDKDFFVNNVKRHGESIIKRLTKGGYKEYKCEKCGINEWNEKPLRLQVHHINGNHCDNRIENLQLLCPNCHSQTDTYGKTHKVDNGGFKITQRIKEILNNSESSINLVDAEIIKKEISENKNKQVKYCRTCGKEITGYGEKYCSHECCNKANMRFQANTEELLESFKSLKSFRSVGRKYGVSDNAVRKRCKKLGIFDEIKKYITPR